MLMMPMSPFCTTASRSPVQRWDIVDEQFDPLDPFKVVATPLLNSESAEFFAPLSTERVDVDIARADDGSFDVEVRRDFTGLMLVRIVDCETGTSTQLLLDVSDRQIRFTIDTNGQLTGTIERREELAF